MRNILAPITLSIVKTPYLCKAIRKRSITPALFIIFSVLISGCDSSISGEEHLNKAKNLIDTKEYNAAEIELKNAVQKTPASAEARKILAEVYNKRQDGKSAEKELHHAEKLGYPKQDLATEFVLSYYYQHKYENLLSFTRPLNVNQLKNQPLVHFYKGLANLFLLRDIDAFIEFEQAADSPKQNKYSDLSTAYLATYKEKLSDKAVTLTSNLVENHPDFAEGHILLAKLYKAKGDFDSALKNLEKAIQLEPNRLAQHVDASELYLLNKQLDKAEKSIDVVLSFAPNHTKSQLIMANIKAHSKQWDEVKKITDNILLHKRIEPQATLLSGIASFHLRSWESSYRSLSSVISKVPQSHIARRMYAFLQYELGYTNEAVSTITSIDNLNNTDGNIINLLGSRLAVSGMTGEALAIFEKAATLEDETTTSLTALGLLKLQQNNQEGLTDLRQALKSDPNSFAARSALVKFYVSEKQFDQAQRLSNELITSEPNLPNGYMLLSATYAQEGKVNKAIATLDAGSSNNPNNTALLMAKARLHFVSNEIQSTKTILEKILQIEPTNPAALRTYYRLSKTLGSTTKALSYFKEAVEQNDADDSLNLVYSLVLIDQKMVDEAINKLKEIDKQSLIYGQAQLGLGNIEYDTGNKGKALPYYQRSLAHSPQDIGAHKATVRTLIELKEFDTALTQLESSLERFPKSMWMKTTYASTLFQTGREGQALKAIAKYNQQQGFTHQLALIQAKFYASSQNYDKAKEQFEIALKLDSSSHTAVLYYDLLAKNDLLEANRFLKQWQRNYPKDEFVTAYAGSLALKNRNSSAVNHFEQLIQKSPDNPIYLNNLASAHRYQGNFSKGLEYAQKAYKSNQNIPEIADTYGYLLLLNGNTTSAVDVLQNAYSSSQGKPTIALHYARSLAQNQQTNEAINILQTLSSKDFIGKKNALALLSELQKNQ
ncbi:MAG: PEP-CTERM system TPR-repeat protein PrsT [Motiliproteus sp.]|nr:PEP-CTERM system TPR-repeat protein PrsT [Motiliproteus sp.]MCW9053302.1 PEP-CTERM system TPR-repeat protein PrsT [Motiliproteus sp.]